MSTAFIAFSTLALASQAIADVIYSSPVYTTVWTAGQPATVSWTNSCDEVVGNTTFPIYVENTEANIVSDIIGYLDCKMPGKSNVMVPATLPQGDTYWIWTPAVASSSLTFTILASTPVSTTTILSTTILSTIILSTIILPTTTVTLTTTGPANPTGSNPAVSNKGDDTKGNGAMIGGTTAAVVAVIAAVALLFFRRLRRQQQPQKVTNAPEATLPSTQFLASMEDPSDRESHHDKSLKQWPIHNPQYIPMRTAQDRPSNPQALIYQLQKENVHSQFAPFHNPQLIPADAQDQSFTTRRSPQGTHAPIPKDNSQNMEQ